MEAFVKQLKSLRQITPAEDWLKENKAQLMSRFFIDQRTPLYFHWPLALVKTVGMALLVLLAAGGTIAAVSAAQNSLPSSFMYPLKITIEKVQLKLVGTAAERANLKAEFTGRRAWEVSRLVSQAPEMSSRQEKEIVRAVDNFKKEIQQVNQHLDQAKQGEAQKAVAMAKQIGLETAKYEDALAETKKKVASLSVEKDIREALASVEETKLASLKVIIEKINPEEEPELLAQVGSDVSDRIQKVEEQLTNVKIETGKIAQGSVESGANSLTKTDAASEILAEAKKAQQEHNLLAALEKAEDSRRLVEEVAAIIAVANSISDNSGFIVGQQGSTASTTTPALSGEQEQNKNTETVDLAPLKTLQVQ